MIGGIPARPAERVAERAEVHIGARGLNPAEGLTSASELSARSARSARSAAYSNSHGRGPAMPEIDDKTDNRLSI
ncbi:hypothetical protein [Kitasatospora sp. NPDC097691]|uniref:hypothetical protein n=1 Tax=Kitasatospora sp. NPDC097691 TaxID=3157231 RepID=UPI0033189D8F